MSDETVVSKPDAAYDTPMQDVHTEDSPSVGAKAVEAGTAPSTSGTAGATSAESEPTPQKHVDTAAFDECKENAMMGTNDPNLDANPSSGSFNDQTRPAASGNANAAPPVGNPYGYPSDKQDAPPEPELPSPGYVEPEGRSQFVVFTRQGGGRVAVRGFDVLEVSEDSMGVVTVMVSGRDPVMGADRNNPSPPTPIRIVVEDSFDDAMKGFTGRYF